ncbi:MAG TPA: LysE family transporter [Firmicutes bacterium]|nr:LysE family transporter [Bacillota bacterium]
MVKIFIQSLLIGYSGAVMPGSLLTYTLERSMQVGVKAGFLVSIGHTLLELLLVMLIFFGFGPYLSTNLAQISIGLLGGMVLFCLGGGMVKESRGGEVGLRPSTAAKTKTGSMLLCGALISVANPYFSLWWAVVGLGLVMQAFNRFGLVGVTLFYLGHIFADFSWYLFVSWLISKTRTFISGKVYRFVLLFLGLCLIGFGAGFFVHALRLIGPLSISGQT